MSEEVISQTPKRKEIVSEINPVTPLNVRVPSVGQPAPIGVFAQSAGVGDGRKFFLTTAINYTNGWPHMGHTYEAIVSDVIARQRRLYGESVFFCTGTDEHGQKISETASRQNMAPLDLCTLYKEGFVV